MQNEETNYLKHGVLLLIANQEELNMFAEVVSGVEVDALHIDEPYVAYMEEVLYVIPQSEIDESHFMYNIKPRKLKSWYKSVQGKMNEQE